MAESKKVFLSRRNSKLVLFAAADVLSFFAAAGYSATTWTAGSGTWDGTATNWSNLTPSQTNPAEFVSLASGSAARTITVSGSRAGIQYSFNSTATGQITFGGSGTLGVRPVSNGGTSLTVLAGSGDHLINVGIQLTGNDSQILDIGSGRTFTIAGLLSGSTTARTFTKSGDGILRLTNTLNSWGSAGVTTTVSAGTLSVPEAYVLGSTSTSVTLDGGALRITSSTQTGNSTRDYIIGSAGGTIEVPTGVAAAYGGSGTARLNLGANTFTKVGAGTLLFTQPAPNNTAGATVNVNEGTLRLGNNGVLPNTTALTLGTPSSTTSGAVNMNGNAQTVVTLATAGTGTENRIYNSVPSPTAALTVNPAANTGSVFGGIIGLSGSANISLTKTGGGTLSLTGNNTYTGATTVNGGTLFISNTSGLGITSAVTVNANGTIGGTGTYSTATTINPGGTISPGESIETLDIGALTLNGTADANPSNNSTIAIEVNQNTAQADKLIIDNGATPLVLTGSTLQFTFVGATAGPFSQSFVIVQDKGNNNPGTSPTFETLTPLSVLSGIVEYSLAYVNSDGGTFANDIQVTFVSVPEPSTALALLGGAAGLLSSRRRRTH